MAPFETLTELSQAIAQQVKTITEILDRNGQPQPSFDIDGPITYPPIGEVQEARLLLINSATRLLQLATGPAESVITTFLNVCVYNLKHGKYPLIGQHTGEVRRHDHRRSSSLQGIRKRTTCRLYLISRTRVKDRSPREPTLPLPSLRPCHEPPLRTFAWPYRSHRVLPHRCQSPRNPSAHETGLRVTVSDQCLHFRLVGEIWRQSVCH